MITAMVVYEKRIYFYLSPMSKWNKILEYNTTFIHQKQALKTRLTQRILQHA